MEEGAVKIDWGFMRLVLIVAVGIAALVILPLTFLTGREVVESVVVSGLASLFHLLVGYACIEVGFNKSNTTFLKIILGGTLVRMVLLVVLVFVLIRFFEFHSLSLMLSFLLFYVVNLVLEIHLLQKKVALKQ